MAQIQVTKDNFETQVLKSEKTVLLDFWAPWCGPCKLIAPIVEEIAEQNDSIVLGKINVDDEMELAVRFGIASLPTLIVIKNGEAAGKLIGYRPKEDILKLLGL